MHKEIQKGQDYTFTWEFFDKNIQEVPTSGTISVYKPGSSTAIVDAATVGIGSDGTITYTLDSSLTGTVDRNYKIELTYIVSGITHRPFYLFSIVETPLINQVRDEHLFHYVPELRDKFNSNTIETTSTGTTTTFVSTELNALNINFKGGFAEIYITDTTVHNAEITAFSESTATFSPAYTSSIASGLRVTLRASYQRFIDDAYNQHVYRDIRNKVPLAAGYIDSTVTQNMTIFKALEIICFGQSEEDGDKWDRRAAKFEQMYKDEFVKLSEAYDIDEDGTISADEDRSRPSFGNVSLRR